MTEPHNAGVGRRTGLAAQNTVQDEPGTSQMVRADLLHCYSGFRLVIVVICAVVAAVGAVDTFFDPGGDRLWGRLAFLMPMVLAAILMSFIVLEPKAGMGTIARRVLTVGALVPILVLPGLAIRRPDVLRRAHAIDQRSGPGATPPLAAVVSGDCLQSGGHGIRSRR